MSNPVYFDIFTTDTHIAYHVSAERDDVVKRKAMSRRTTIDNPNAGKLVVDWVNDAYFHGCERAVSHK